MLHSTSGLLQTLGSTQAPSMQNREQQSTDFVHGAACGAQVPTPSPAVPVDPTVSFAASAGGDCRSEGSTSPTLRSVEHPAAHAAQTSTTHPSVPPKCSRVGAGGFGTIEAVSGSSEVTRRTKR
ncbi:MAG TPA: hypothetical protein VF881_06670 [Polyangiaceae bacterium]